MSEIQEKAKKILLMEKDIIALFLFGSESTGKAREESDVDLAVLFRPNNVPDSMKVIEMREKLNDALHKDVDLVCLNTASPIIGRQVLKNGKELFNLDKKQYNKYVIDLLTDYADLKRLRRPIEESILKRKFYG